MLIKVNYKINDPNINEKSEVLISFFKSNNSFASNRYLLTDHLFDYKKNITGFFYLKIKNLQNGPGIYEVNIAIRKEKYTESFLSNKFFSISENVYDQHNRLYEFKIMDSKFKINTNVSFISSNYEWINND